MIALLLMLQQAADTIQLKPVVVTASRVDVPPGALPAAVTVLRGADLQARGIRTVAQALQLVPGAHIVETGSYGGQTSLFTHMHVRDDAMILFGFPTRDERDTFEALIGTTGVGPKLALAMLSVHSPSALRRALLEDDLAALTMVSGVGKRTAQRLLVELKAKLAVPEVDLTEPGGAPAPRAEVRAALSGLGYAPDEVRDVVAQLPEDGSVEDLLREALKLLAVTHA